MMKSLKSKRPIETMELFLQDETMAKLNFENRARASEKMAQKWKKQSEELKKRLLENETDLHVNWITKMEHQNVVKKLKNDYKQLQLAKQQVAAGGDKENDHPKKTLEISEDRRRLKSPSKLPVAKPYLSHRR